MPEDAGECIKTEIQLNDLERAIFAEGVAVTTPALCELLKRQIPVTYLSWHGRLLGSFEAGGPPRGASRFLQYKLSCNPAGCLAIAICLVRAKISNARRLLQRLNANHHRLEPLTAETLEARENDAARSTDLAILHGYEGTAAAVFYQAWAQFLPEDFSFVQRSTRPPANPVNACLSYLSALVYGELLTACNMRGLAPALGCLHLPEDGR